MRRRRRVLLALLLLALLGLALGGALTRRAVRGASAARGLIARASFPARARRSRSFGRVVAAVVAAAVVVAPAALVVGTVRAVSPQAADACAGPVGVTARWAHLPLRGAATCEPRRGGRAR